MIDKHVFDAKKIGARLDKSIFAGPDGYVEDLTFSVTGAYSNEGQLYVFPNPIIETAHGRMLTYFAVQTAADKARKRFGPILIRDLNGKTN